MSETKMVVIPKDTIRKLKNISTKLAKLNVGSVGDDFWLASGTGDSGGYDWSQFDIGVTKDKQLITCDQSGCSCNGPEQPTADAHYALDEEIELEEGYDGDVKDAVDDLIGTTDTLYKVLNGKVISPKEIIGLPNAEIRRAVVELVGYDKIVSEATVLDESEVDGKLLRIPLTSDEDIVLLHVKDPSTVREYFLRVPPQMKKAKQARAWTFGFEAKDFVLEKES